MLIRQDQIKRNQKKTYKMYRKYSNGRMNNERKTNGKIF